MRNFQKLLIVSVLLSSLGFLNHDFLHRNPLVTVSTSMIYKEGNLSLSNTSEIATIMDYGVEEGNIGTTYNFTIQLDASSTSGINLTLIKMHDWRGSPHIFPVVPGETRTVMYVQHSTADERGMLNLEYHLLNTSGTVTGTYQVRLVFGGYPVDIGTGGLYVEDITAWLRTRSQTKPSTITFSFSPLMLLLLVYVYIYCRKKKNRPSKSLG